MPQFRRLCLLICSLGLAWVPTLLWGQTPMQQTCAGERLSFPTSIATKLGRIERWEWNFGDPASGAANTSTERIPSHTFAEPGEYLVSLFLETDRGIADTIRTRVLVLPRPTATFRLLDSCARDTLRLLAPAAGRYDQLRWYLNDQPLALNRSSVAHPLPQAGRYVVSLYVVDSLGCRAMSRQYLRWPLTPPPPAVQGDTVCFGEAAQLEGRAAPGSYLQWLQRDESGTFTRLSQQPRLQTLPLSFSTTYYAQAIDSLSGCASRPVAGLAMVHRAATGRILYRIRNPEQIPAEVSFQAKLPSEPLHYQWDFGDDSGSQSPQPVHRYTQPGAYRVRAFLHYAHGCEITLQSQVHIMAPPVVALPSSFSPNGDGFNDTFALEHVRVKNLWLRIFDRRGQLVFETRDPAFVWDGRGLTGRLVPEGLYVCLIEGRDPSGQPIEQRETLTIIR